jgi:hypothetical protein
MIAAIVLCSALCHETKVSGAQRFRFTDATSSARFFTLPTQGGHGVQCADATGDGWVDIYVTNIFNAGENRRELFFVNQANGTFHEQATRAGVADDGFYGRVSEESHAAVFADLDNDGDFDIFNAHTWSGNHKLYRNDGTGSFADVTARSGIEIDRGEPRGVAAGDINGDGIYDLIVSAWAGLPIHVYFGRGNLTYGRPTLLLGRGATLANQGIMLVDYDGDHDLDLATTGHMVIGGSVGPLGLFRNDGRGKFTDVTASSGVQFENEGANGWSFGDLDNDADLDAVIVGQHGSKVYLNVGGGRFRLQQLLGRGNFTAALGDFDHDSDLDIYIGGAEAIYRNNGGAHFELIRDIGISRPGADGRGTAVVDVDSDGDLDIVLVSKKGHNTLFRNEVNDSNWLQVSLIGPRGDKGAFGAKVFVYDSRHVEDPRHLRGYREARGATGYCSQDTPILHFGVPGGESYDVKAVFMDGTFFIVKGVVAPAEIAIDPNAPIR